MNITLPDFLTEEQIKEAMKLYEKAKPGTFASQCAKKIIEPNLEVINKKLGQDNDPKFLGYAVEYVFNMSRQ